MTAEAFHHEPRRDAPGDHRDESSQLDDSVSPGQSLRGQQLRQQSIFRRPENRRLRARQKYRGHLQRQISRGKRRHRQPHHADLEHLRPDRHASFAETVREIPAGHRKQNEWRGKQKTDDRHKPVAILLGEIHGQDQEDDELFQAVLIERTLKLRGNQAPKAQPPLPVTLSLQRTSVV